MTTGNGAAASLAAPFAITLADGSGRFTLLDQWREYACPWCHYVVCSPEGQDERNRVSREYAELAGEHWTPQPYGEHEREVYGRRGCCNPACLVNMTAEQLAVHRERQAAADAEAERQAGISRWFANYQAETKAAEDRAWAAISAQAAAAGQCIDCLRTSYWQSHPKLVVHRDPRNCPVRRRYSAA